LQSPLDLSDDHLDCDRVVAAARHDDIGVTLARLDELQMHWLHRGQILIDDFVERPAAVVGITLDATNETDVGIGIDEDLYIAQVADALVDEQQYSVDHHHVGRLDASGARLAQMRHEIILGFVNRLPLAERVELGVQQVVVECVGMVPVEFPPLLERKLREVVVVSVHVDEGDGRRRQQLGDVASNGGFSRSGSAGNSDDERFQHFRKLRAAELERIMPDRV